MEAQTHDTVLIGWDKEGKVVFLKSYDYTKQKDEAQSDLKELVNAGVEFQLGKPESLRTVSIGAYDFAECIIEMREDEENLPEYYEAIVRGEVQEAIMGKFEATRFENYAEAEAKVEELKAIQPTWNFRIRRIIID